MTIKEKVMALNVDLQNLHENYSKAFTTLEQYAGQPVDKVGVEKVNSMLEDIRVAFKEIYPILTFIQSNYQFSTKLLNHHSDFLVQLKKEEESSIITEH